jgi:plastocyanin
LAVVAALSLVVPLNAVADQRRTHHAHRGTAAKSKRVRAHATPSKVRRHRPRANRHRHHPRVSANLGAALALQVTRGHGHRTAHAAGDPSDTISDFKFTPATVTIHTGDTITWTNDGPSEHTATASNGSFDTGILKKGQSGSHTFTQPGTYAYICTIHPFMHGTIVVLASTTTTTTTTSTPTTTPTSTTPSTGSTTPSSSASTQTSGATLPMTGFDLDATWIAGIVFIGAAILIRRKLRTRS